MTSNYGKEFSGLEGTYDLLDSGYFKQLYVNEENDSLLYFPHEGDTLRERMGRVLTWQHNIEKLQEYGVELPFDRHAVVVTELDGETEPVLVTEYEEELKDGERLSDETQDLLDEWQRYQHIVDGLWKHGEIAYANADIDEVKERNYGIHPEKGAVLLDFGEIFDARSFFLISGQHRRAESFYEEHGIDEHIESIIGDIQRGLGERLWEQVKQWMKL